MDEQRKYDVIKKLVEENGSKDRAALTLDITKRQVNRLIKKYRENGKEAFRHGNRGRKPATTIPQERRSVIVDLYRTKYYDANFTHFTELLRANEQIRVSTGTVASILEAEYIFSPKATKAKRKRIARQLRQKQKGKGRDTKKPCGRGGCPLQAPQVRLFRRAHPNGRLTARMGSWPGLASPRGHRRRHGTHRWRLVRHAGDP